MKRPATLFTGQFADIPLTDLAPMAAEWGYDGLELACWGDHFEVDKALEDDAYLPAKWDLLNKYGQKCFSISSHLVGQCICDPIDDRHKAILPPRLWGDGDPEGVRQRCAEEMKDTARAARKFGVDVVNGSWFDTIVVRVDDARTIHTEAVAAGMNFRKLLRLAADFLRQIYFWISFCQRSQNVASLAA